MVAVLEIDSDSLILQYQKDQKVLIQNLRSLNRNLTKITDVLLEERGAFRKHLFEVQSKNSWLTQRIEMLHKFLEKKFPEVKESIDPNGLPTLEYLKKQFRK